MASTEKPVFLPGEGLSALEASSFGTEAESQTLLVCHPRILDFGSLADGRPSRRAARDSPPALRSKCRGRYAKCCWAQNPVRLTSWAVRSLSEACGHLLERVHPGGTLIIR